MRTTGNPISVRKYLKEEIDSPMKHEFVDGRVYGLADVRNAHNRIKGNIFGTAHFLLRGRSCRPHGSGTKVRILSPTEVRFYCPDDQIVCEPNGPDDTWQDKPVVIFEVLSPRTRRTDEGEKKDAYLTIPTLAVYALVEQDEPAIVAFRRTANGFERAAYQGLEVVLPLPEVGIDLPLAEIYEGIVFQPEADPS